MGRGSSKIVWKGGERGKGSLIAAVPLKDSSHIFKAGERASQMIRVRVCCLLILARGPKKFLKSPHPQAAKFSLSHSPLLSIFAGVSEGFFKFLAYCRRKRSPSLTQSMKIKSFSFDKERATPFISRLDHCRIPFSSFLPRSFHLHPEEEGEKKGEEPEQRGEAVVIRLNRQTLSPPHFLLTMRPPPPPPSQSIVGKGGQTLFYCHHFLSKPQSR